MGTPHFYFLEERWQYHFQIILDANYVSNRRGSRYTRNQLRTTHYWWGVSLRPRNPLKEFFERVWWFGFWIEHRSFLRCASCEVCSIIEEDLAELNIGIALTEWCGKWSWRKRTKRLMSRTIIYQRSALRYTINSFPTQDTGTGQWRLSISISWQKDGQSIYRPYWMPVTYPTEVEADIHGYQFWSTDHWWKSCWPFQ